MLFHLELVSRIPLTAPNVDKATNTGIVHAIGPYSLSANVYNNKYNVIIYYIINEKFKSIFIIYVDRRWRSLQHIWICAYDVYCNIL